MFVINSFSLNMVSTFPVDIRVEPLTFDEARQLARGCQSAVGHADTAAVFSSVLGIEIPFNRVSITVDAGDQLLVGQYKGPRLPEGATALPEGATIEWLRVEIEKKAFLADLRSCQNCGDFGYRGDLCPSCGNPI